MRSQPIEVLSRSGIGRDRYGNRVLTADTATSTVYGWVEQTSTTEADTGSQDTTSVESTALIDGPVDLTEGDRLRVGAVVWEVQGEPNAVATPRGVHHTEVRLRRSI